MSSLYCRAMDTAKLTKLGPVTPQPVLNQVFLADIGGMREAGSQRPGAPEIRLATASSPCWSRT